MYTVYIPQDIPYASVVSCVSLLWCMVITEMYFAFVVYFLTPDVVFSTVYGFTQSASPRVETAVPRFE